MGEADDFTISADIHIATVDEAGDVLDEFDVATSAPVRALELASDEEGHVGLAWTQSDTGSDSGASRFCVVRR